MCVVFEQIKRSGELSENNLPLTKSVNQSAVMKCVSDVKMCVYGQL